MAKKSGMDGFFNSVFKLGKTISKEVNSAKNEREKSGGYQASVKPAKIRTDTFTPWNLETDTIVEFDGEYEKKVIVYDGKPLLGLSNGDEFELGVFLGDGEMYSRFTDWKQSSQESNYAIITYQGQPIGFGHLSLKVVKDLAKKGIALKLKGVCHGELDGYDGIKNIVFMSPFDWIYLNDVLDLAVIQKAGGPTRCPSIEYNECDEDDFQQIATRKRWIFDKARIEVIQPEKANMKPRIAIYAGEKMVSKVEPKNRSCYSDLMELAESGEKIIVSASRCEGVEDKDFYHISVYHWPEE